MTWWWIHGVSSSTDPAVERMLLWEGGFLLAIIFLGGGALLFYTRSHQLRHQKLKLFFSMFAHDLKTSIARLRIQTEILQDEYASIKEIKQISENVRRINYQLENSLWLSSLEEQKILQETFKLSQVLRTLKTEFPEIIFELNQDCQLNADHRAFEVIIRNMVQNSIIHAKAEIIYLKALAHKTSELRLEISDNGIAKNLEVKDLGRSPWTSSRTARSTNGLGLYLCRRLIEKMKGKLHFQVNTGLVTIIEIQGKLL